MSLKLFVSSLVELSKAHTRPSLCLLALWRSINTEKSEHRPEGSGSGDYLEWRVLQKESIVSAEGRGVLREWGGGGLTAEEELVSRGWEAKGLWAVWWTGKGPAEVAGTWRTLSWAKQPVGRGGKDLRKVKAHHLCFPDTQWESK